MDMLPISSESLADFAAEWHTIGKPSLIAKGATYAERLLSDGGFWQGVAAGYGFRSETVRRSATKSARRHFAEWRKDRGYAGGADILTRPESQPKLGKSERYALGLMLTPERGLSREVLEDLRVELSKPVNLCPLASLGCAMACLNTSGKGAMASVQRARAARTAYLLTHPYEAGVLVGAETRRAVDKQGPGNVTLRLNVLSDIRWERLAGAETYAPALGKFVRLYDYTAHTPETRADAESLGFHLTYSAKESSHTSDEYLARVLDSGRSVAMPFTTRKGQALPEWHALAGRTYRVIDGDLSDDRTDDARGVIVGLRAKGAAGRADTSGFIRVPNHGRASDGSLA